jgi:hypothetical protein
MTKRSNRFVAKAEKGVGWRVWDNVQHKFWGPLFPSHPIAILAELNGDKRGTELDKLVASAKRRTRTKV